MILNTCFKHAPCPTCSGPVSGRKDKRFCTVKCKNEHHRIARTQLKSRYHEIQKRIRRNLVVMEGILGPTAKGMEIHKDALFQFGFDLSTCSGTKLISNEYWLELGDYQFKTDSFGIVTVVRINKLSAVMPGFFVRWEIEFPKDMKVDGNWNPLNELNKESYFSRWDE